jgi:hypothetical protein
MEVYSMTDTTPLSPAAQAMLKAACIHHGLFNEEIIQRRRMLAAALQAAADQVVPEFWHEEGDVYGETMQDVRQKLFAIAAELEAQ